MVLQLPRDDGYDHAGSFVLGPNETLADAIALFDEVGGETEAVVAGIDDLGQPVPIDKSVPWNPQDYDNWSVRWVLLHLIQETARHSGHADIVRETIDGGSAFPLMAAAEGWPETDFIKPWKAA